MVMKFPLFSLLGMLLISSLALVQAQQMGPTFTSQPQSRLVALGESATFSATVIGDPVITYQWRKGTAKVNGATDDELTLLQTKATDAAIYRLLASNPVGGPQLSNETFLGVVSPMQGRQVLKEGSTLNLRCVVAAPKSPNLVIRYSWQRDGAALTNGQQVNSTSLVAGADTASLSITKTDIENSGIYTCEVTMLVATTPVLPGVENGSVEVRVVNAVPVMDANPLPPNVSVSQSMDYTVSGTNFPTGFTVTGLPKGLKMDSKTGRITGKPTVPSKPNTNSPGYQPNKIKFKATNPQGTGPEVTFDLIIEPLDPSYVGTFHGIVARSAASNFGMGGHVQFTVTSAGSISGSATLAGRKHGVAGVLDLTLGNDPSMSLLIKRNPASLGDLWLKDLTIIRGDDLMTGKIIDPQFEMMQGVIDLGEPEEPDLVDGSFGDARFNSPCGIAILPNGSGYIADTGNHVIRYVDSGAETVTTFAGNASSGASDDTGLSASFSGPEGLALDKLGNLFVADTGNSTIRKVTPAGVVTTFAGVAGQIGSTNGLGSAARFDKPCALCFDPDGNLYVADRGNHMIRKITASGLVSTLAGKAARAEHSDGSGVKAGFNEPKGITYDPVLKALFVADTRNRVVRKVTLAGAVTTYAGSPGVDAASDGLFVNTRFTDPAGILSLGNGSLMVLDTSLVQLNPNGTACRVFEIPDTVDVLDRRSAAAVDPVEGTLITVHNWLHAISSHEAVGPAENAIFDAKRNSWLAASNLVPANEQGLYNAILETTVAPTDDAFPQGYGFVQVAVGKTGLANWAGKAADGSTLTFGTFMAESNRIIPLHASLYKNTGSLQGECFVNSGTLDLANDVTPAFDWYKIRQPFASTDRYYKDGFSLHPLEVTGGKYTPNQLYSYLYPDVTAPFPPQNMWLRFEPSRINLFSQVCTLKSPSSVTVPVNAKSLTMKVDPRTGIFSGSFKEVGPAVTVPFAGILMNYVDGNARQGFGHYLIPDSEAKNSPVQSSPMTLEP